MAKSLQKVNNLNIESDVNFDMNSTDYITVLGFYLIFVKRNENNDPID